MKQKFIKILREYGYKSLKKHRDDVLPYQKGNDPSNSSYAEIQIYEHDVLVWFPTERYLGTLLDTEEKIIKHLKSIHNGKN